jgi:hypothetical protein
LLMCFLKQLPHTACQLCQFTSDVPVARSGSLRPAQRDSLGHDASWTRTGGFLEMSLVVIVYSFTVDEILGS